MQRRKRYSDQERWESRKETLARSRRRGEATEGETTSTLSSLSCGGAGCERGGDAISEKGGSAARTYLKTLLQG
jgi:hypothetical protein